MPSWLPSIPYGPPREGIWLPVTSTLNWCEEDYYATPYSAEIVNTLTNLLFIYLAFSGIYNCLKHGHDGIFIVTYVGYLIVGSGSFLFHATLKYPMQLVDELSMIYTTCLMCYATFSYGKSNRYAIFLGVFLISLSFFITLYYHYLQDPTFHQVMYGILTAVVLLRSIWIMEVNIRPSFRRRWSEQSKDSPEPEFRNEPLSPGSQREIVRKDKRDIQILRTMWIMIAYGLSIFLGGFAIWNLDNAFCPTLRSWRREIGLPWGIFLEGHGWWHLMTGIGANFYIVWGIWLRHCLNARQDDYELVWPRLATSLPTVVRREGYFSEGRIQKDAAKKEL